MNTKTKVLRVSALLVLLIVVVLVWHIARAKAGSGLTILPKGSYHLLTIPETQLVMISTQESWAKIVKHHYPYGDPKTILGMAIETRQYYPKGYISYYTIFIPFNHPAIKKWTLLESIFGHEVMHIVDFSIGMNVFSPDEERRREAQK